MIKMIVAGILGGDAEVRNVSNNQSVISFSVAHTEKWLDANNVKQSRTIWVRCSLWRKSDKTAIAQYLTKGSYITLEGTPGVSAYKNAQGEAMAGLECTVREIDLQGGSKAAGATQTGTGQNNTQPVNNSAAPAFNGGNNYQSDNDDLPF